MNATHTYLLFGEHGISNGYTFILRVIERSVATYLVGSSEPTFYGMGPDSFSVGLLLPSFKLQKNNEIKYDRKFPPDSE